MADLRSGKSWLTVTVGNWLTEAKNTDTRYPAELLSSEKEKAAPLKIPRLSFYYGRLLFEDGSPAVLDRPPWPGAEIFVDFPYAGSGHLDKQGYFQVFFEPEQLEQLKSRKPGRNIYVPRPEQGSSTATETFPADLLSRDKGQAGVLKIPKPVIKPIFDPAQSPSLIGKALPALDNLGLSSMPAGSANGMVLLCFFDVLQKPSRHCVTQLASQVETLKTGGVSVGLVQASGSDRKAMEEFVQAERVPFPIGKIRTDEEKTRFDWGIKSLPWLILTDRIRIVRAEGFSAQELQEKLIEVTSGGKGGKSLTD